MVGSILINILKIYNSISLDIYIHISMKSYTVMGFDIFLICKTFKVMIFKCTFGYI